MLKLDNQLLISWDDIEDLVDKLSHKIQLDLPFITSITGIARGGLIPAIMLSHKLGVPFVQTISTNTLVVDDICDTGKTLKEGIGIYTAVLFHKPHTSSFEPNLYAKKHEGDEWIRFPWEKVNSTQLQDYLQTK